MGTFFHGGGFFFHGIPSEATPSMRLPSTRLFWGRSYKFTGHQYFAYTRQSVSFPPSEELTQSRDNLSSHRVKNLLLAISMRQFLCPCIQAVPHLCMQAFHGDMQVRKRGGWLVTMSARVVRFARENRRIELMLIKDIFLQHHWLHCLKVCRFARCIRNRLSALVA